MKLRAARAVLATGLFALSLLCSMARADAVEIQKADPAECGDDDKSCIQAWYKEYAGGIIGEFKYYAGQEDFLADMLASPQESLLTAKLSLLLIEGGTRYDQWAAIKDEQVARNAGLDMLRYGALLGACHDAIAGMRTALFDMRRRRDNARAEAGQYLKSAVACEKAFALPAAVSRLRNPRPARVPAPAIPAPHGPMDITPAVPQP